ncbi:hypothetical protein NAPIS_ORF00287 [Vairimorpha apis BRL 01]|uniref:Uncharacterized protein n=1 Tax=Vairimorpha apis BRL 01 TaxID=1037528 RepID=T0L3S7_9MICR|nr:hypothetical protein NAPIS_ORF00287 [Vairimorpha apis BRL 01]
MEIIKNEYIMPIILNLENRRLDEQKILYIIIITNEILNIDINNNFKNDNKQILLERILSTNFFKKHNNKFINYNLYKKALQINLNVLEKYITYEDILKTTIKYINNLKEINTRFLFIFGFQSLFNTFSKEDIPRLYYIITILHTLIKDKDNYDLYFHEKMFNILSLSYSKYKNIYNYVKFIEKDFESDLFKIIYIYLIMNSVEIKSALQKFKEIQNDEIHFTYINYLIILTNKLKANCLE